MKSMRTALGAWGLILSSSALPATLVVDSFNAIDTDLWNGGGIGVPPLPGGTVMNNQTFAEYANGDSELLYFTTRNFIPEGPRAARFVASNYFIPFDQDCVVSAIGEIVDFGELAENLNTNGDSVDLSLALSVNNNLNDNLGIELSYQRENDEVGYFVDSDVRTETSIGDRDGALRPVPGPRALLQIFYDALERQLTSRYRVIDGDGAFVDEAQDFQVVSIDDTFDLAGSQGFVISLTGFAEGHLARGEAAWKVFTASNATLSPLAEAYLDTDDDGMSDSFEEQYFGSATGGEPGDDPDGDGATNLEEFLYGTDPTDPRSVPSLNLSTSNGMLALKTDLPVNRTIVVEGGPAPGQLMPVTSPMTLEDFSQQIVPEDEVPTVFEEPIPNVQKILRVGVSTDLDSSGS